MFNKATKILLNFSGIHSKVEFWLYVGIISVILNFRYIHSLNVYQTDGVKYFY